MEERRKAELKCRFGHCYSSMLLYADDVQGGSVIKFSDVHSKLELILFSLSGTFKFRNKCDTLSYPSVADHKSLASSKSIGRSDRCVCHLCAEYADEHGKGIQVSGIHLCNCKYRVFASNTDYWAARLVRAGCNSWAESS